VEPFWNGTDNALKSSKAVLTAPVAFYLRAIGESDNF